MYSTVLLCLTNSLKTKRIHTTEKMNQWMFEEEQLCLKSNQIDWIHYVFYVWQTNHAG